MDPSQISMLLTLLRSGATPTDERTQVAEEITRILQAQQQQQQQQQRQQQTSNASLHQLLTATLSTLCNSNSIQSQNNNNTISPQMQQHVNSQATTQYSNVNAGALSLQMREADRREEEIRLLRERLLREGTASHLLQQQLAAVFSALGNSSRENLSAATTSPLHQLLNPPWVVNGSLNNGTEPERNSSSAAASAAAFAVPANRRLELAISTTGTSTEPGTSSPPSGHDSAASSTSITSNSSVAAGESSSQDNPSKNKLFVYELSWLLEDIERVEQKASVVSWNPDGEAFTIHNERIFQDKYCPIYFRHNSIKKFKRTLRHWGFTETLGGSYEHPKFLRHRPELRVFMTNDIQNPTRPLLGNTSTPATIYTSTAMSSSQGGHRTDDSRSLDSSDASIRQTKRRARIKAQNDKGRPRKKQKSFTPNETKSEGSESVADVGTEATADTNSLPDSCSSHGMFKINTVHDREDICGLMFPWNLHRMLDETGNSDDVDTRKVVYWQEDGASFRIKNEKLFTEKIMPKFFEEKTWSAFTKSLSSWGFVYFTSGGDKGSFVHRLFVRGKPTLCRQMRCDGNQVSEMFKYHGAMISRLHEVLSVLKKDQTDGEKLASWSPDGKSFTISNPKKFLDQVFAVYFDRLTRETFEQRLKSWGFLRTPIYYEGAGEVSFSHPSFSRDQAPTFSRTPSVELGRSIKAEYSFLVRLRIMLDDMDRYGHRTVVSWMPHGKAFMIHDRKAFSDLIMCRYICSKFTNFRQALRNHGFAQVAGNGWDVGAYHHKLFVRDDPGRSQGMTQQQMKDAMPSWIHPKDEPNFYSETPQVQHQEVIPGFASIDS